MHILLVEDNAGDVRLMLEVFKESPTKPRLSIVTDGEQAMDFLRRQGAYRGAERPDLIILDLHLPRKDGREVLTELRADPEFRALPVFVLTSSLAQDDQKQAAALGVERFLRKPVDVEEYFALVQDVAAWGEMRSGQ